MRWIGPMPTGKQWLLIIQIWVGVAIAIGGCHWLRTLADSRYIARRCERRIRKSVDPNELQRWAADILRRYPPDTATTPAQIAPPRTLEGIWRNRPSVALQPTIPDEEAHVRIIWGGGFLGHWELLLGSTNFVAGGKCKRWQPGAYFCGPFP